MGEYVYEKIKPFEKNEQELFLKFEASPCIIHL